MLTVVLNGLDIAIVSGANSSRIRVTDGGRDVEMMLELDFEEAIFGVETEVKLTVNDVCEHCKGTTAEPGYE